MGKYRGISFIYMNTSMRFSVAAFHSKFGAEFTSRFSMALTSIVFYGVILFLRLFLCFLQRLLCDTNLCVYLPACCSRVSCCFFFLNYRPKSCLLGEVKLR